MISLQKGLEDFNELRTTADIVKIAENMCNLYYFNEGANEIIDNNISDYLYRNYVKEGVSYDNKD